MRRDALELGDVAGECALSITRMALLTLLPLLLLQQLLLRSGRVAVQAHTVRSQLKALETIRDVNANRSLNWQNALSSWNCPTDPDDSDEQCDPCSKDWSGNWEHIHCRGADGHYGEGSIGLYDGYVTTVHVTDCHLDGPPAKEWCLLDHLRELDLDGGNQNGPFPEWFQHCVPLVQELDLSYNRLTGFIPEWISTKTTLQEFKVEHNSFSGSAPAALGGMPNLWRIRLAYNHFHGTLPSTWSNLSDTLNQLDISHNNFSGNLSVFGASKLMFAAMHTNAGLCGMVPAGVRYASGFNPAGTRLGLPC